VMRQAVNVMFLGGAKRVSMGRWFIEAGASLGLDVNLFSYELSAQVPIASVARVIIGRRWSDADLMEHIHETVRDNRIDILIPFVDPAVEIAARYCVSDGECWTPGSNTEMVARMFDKAAADAVFRSFGFPLPADAMTEAFPGMIIAKPRRGSASKGIRVIDRAEMLRMKDDGEAEAFVFQEYISDREEFTVDCYVGGDGAVVCTVPRCRIEVSGGEVTVTQTIRHNEMEEWSRRILSDLKLTGPVTLQFLRERDESGRLMLMEINPRLGGGAVCAIHAGANLPEFILREWMGQKLEPCNNWKGGVKVCRYLQEVVFCSEESI
ncbi:MAG: ATP-grasp domain-containing protein, partial [Muribaculaceae bacterium]|nr:ATP-grasp domain-containing protein [Muribaculaceae bacterium]